MTDNRPSRACVWDFTLPYEFGYDGDEDGEVYQLEERVTKEELIEFLEANCKKWCFQLEKGKKNGFLHYQGRLSLKLKARRNELFNMFGKSSLGMPHLSRTSNTNKDNDFYVMKDDTRVEGPWSNETVEEKIFVQDRFKGEVKLHPFQQTITDMIKTNPDPRTVNGLYNPNGNVGKSFLTLYLLTMKLAEILPVFNDAKEILEAVMNLPKSKAYFLDLPRAANQKQMQGYFAAIEMIKNGYVYDKRYKFRRTVFNPPHVWVFMNVFPDFKLLSEDRWVMWEINDKMELVKVDMKRIKAWQGKDEEEYKKYYGDDDKE